MPIGIYADVQIPRPIVTGLRLRGVDVLTAQEDGMGEAEDSAILDRAAVLGRIVLTHDDDFLKEASRRFLQGEEFGGVVFARQLRAPIGPCIEDLELIATTFDIADLTNRIEFIPY
jgi:hypothetical protein